MSASRKAMASASGDERKASALASRREGLVLPSRVVMASASREEAMVLESHAEGLGLVSHEGEASVSYHEALGSREAMPSACPLVSLSLWQ